MLNECAIPENEWLQTCNTLHDRKLRRGPARLTQPRANLLWALARSQKRTSQRPGRDQEGIEPEAQSCASRLFRGKNNVAVRKQ